MDKLQIGMNYIILPVMKENVECHKLIPDIKLVAVDIKSSALQFLLSLGEMGHGI